MKDTIYVSKNANYDGYNQAFSQIMDGKKGIQHWARDGSLKDGDVVYQCVPIYTFEKGKLLKVKQNRKRGK